MKRLALVAMLCLTAGCGTRPSVTSQAPPPPGGGVEAADAEKKAFQDFLRRKLPDTDGLEIVEWKVTQKGEKRNIEVDFRAKGDRGNKVLWYGEMTVTNGKIGPKRANYTGPDYGRSFTDQIPAGLDVGRQIYEP